MCVILLRGVNIWHGSNDCYLNILFSYPYMHTGAVRHKVSFSEHE